MRWLIILLVLLLALLLWLSGRPADTPERFGTAHSLSIATDAGSGLHEPVNAAIGDINGDDLADLIVANGRDQSANALPLEPILVYFNQGETAPLPYAPFANPPSGAELESYVWRSNTKRRYTHVCPVDVNGDGCMDVAATFIEISGETLDIYLNERDGNACSGLQEPPTTLPRRYPDTAEIGAAWGCTVGDVDADGDGDIGVAEAYATEDTDPWNTSAGLIYLLINAGGTLSHSWQNAESDIRHAFDLTFADVDADGRLDVAAAMAGLRIYTGNGTLFDTTASRSWDMGSKGFTADVDTSWIEEDGRSTRGVLVAGNNRFNTATSHGYYRLFETCTGNGGLCEIWTSPDSGKGDAVALLDFDSNGYVDTASARWSEKGCNEPFDTSLDSALLYWDMLQGNEVMSLSNVVSRDILGQGLVAWEFDPEEIKSRDFEIELPAGARFLSFDGADAPTFVMSVDRVVGPDGDELGYHFAPGNDWLSLQPPLSDAGSVKVSYQTSDSPDLLVVDGCGFVHFFRN